MSMHYSSDMINMAVIQKNGVLENLWLHLKLEVKEPLINYILSLRDLKRVDTRRTSQQMA